MKKGKYYDLSPIIRQFVFDIKLSPSYHWLSYRELKGHFPKNFTDLGFRPSYKRQKMISDIMDSQGFACSHEKERSEINSLIEELCQEKMGLETSRDDIDEKLFIIEEFLEDFTLPGVIREAIREKEDDLIDERRSHGYRMYEIDTEIADWEEEMKNEKKKAEKTACACIKI